VKKKVTLAISPCPNDTFAFYHFIKTLSIFYDVEVVYHDIEELNRCYFEKKYDIIKASFACAFSDEANYELLSSGSAIGFGVGPVAITHKDFQPGKKNIRVLLPGEYTTAKALWDFYQKKNQEFAEKSVTIEYLIFSRIMEKIANSEADVGVIIHEGRFIYPEKGLKLLVDLGDFWERENNAPVPLGGIFVGKWVDESLKIRISGLLKESVQYAIAHREANDTEYNKKIIPFIKNYAQEQSDSVIENHIKYYVNKESIEFSADGIQAIELFKRYIQGSKRAG